MTRISTPKFITWEIAQTAVRAAYEMIVDPPETDGHGITASADLQTYLRPRRRQCHIVVLVPGMEDDTSFDHHQWPNYPLKPVALYEESFLAGADSFEAPFDKIAQCKAMQLWFGRNDGGTDCLPHLLYKGDTPYYGGVNRNGIVVSCSGIQAYLDRLVSGVVADLIIGMAYAAWDQSGDKANKVDFLT